MRFKNWTYPIIKDGKPTIYNWVVSGLRTFKMGRGTDIGAFTYIQAKSCVLIEDDVQIGSHCAIYSESTIDDKRGQVTLKSGCKIGSHSTIMPGVTVGENAIIGAHSFVNKDIPAGSVAFGVPVEIQK